MRKTTTTMMTLFTGILCMALWIGPASATAQTSKLETSVVKDGYVMIDGKMMELKDGKMTPMKKKAVMTNGTKVSKKGRVKLADGTRSRMQDGNCIDNTGKIEDCNVNSDYYTCTHHKDVRAASKGKCPKCGMDLMKKSKA